MKRILALLLVAVMVLGLTAIPAKAEAETYPVIKFAYTKMFATPDEPYVEEEMNKILREKCGCEIDLVAIDFSNMQQQFNLLLTGGSDSIDIFSSFWYMPFTTLVSNGQLADITDLLAAHPEVTEIWKDYPEVLEACKLNGRFYALPTYGCYSSPMMFLCMEDDALAANIDWSQVKTLNDATEVMLKMKEVNPTHYYVPGATETYYVPKDIDTLNDNTNFLGVLTDPLNSTKVENYYESDYFMNFMEQVKIWQANDIITPDPMSNTFPTLMSLQSGLSSGTPGYGLDAEEFCYEANLQQQYGGNVVAVNLGERLITSSNIQTYLWHITSFCKQKELAMDVLAAFYTEPKLNDLLGNGVEGRNYVVREDGTLEFPEGKDMTNCGWTGLGASYSLPNCNGCPVWFYQPADYWKLLWDLNEVSVPSKALGFTFDPSPVADQVTACANVIAQYYLPLINGEVDIDSVLPVFQQALHDAGIDNIIAEKQSQLDAWLASK